MKSKNPALTALMVLGVGSYLFWGTIIVAMLTVPAFGMVGFFGGMVALIGVPFLVWKAVTG